MSDELADHRESFALNMTLDGAGNVIDPLPRHGLFDSPHQRIARHPQQLLLLLIDRADRIGAGTITMIFVELDTDIDGDDISLLEGSIAREPMDDDVVERHAECRGIGRRIVSHDVSLE